MWYKSATKLVLIGLILASIAGFFIGKLSEQNFMLIVLPVIAFYFGQKFQETKLPTQN